MGHQHRHYPKCWNCKHNFPHNLMVKEKVRYPSGYVESRHYCIPCYQESQKLKMKEA